MLKRLVMAGLLIPLTLFSQEAPHIKVAGRDVAIWKPAGVAPKAGNPLIVFSHGFGGCNTQSIFLMEALARAGYLVLAPNHADARCGSARGQRRGAGFGRPEEPFQNPEKWTDATYKDRADDIRAVVDETLRGENFQGVSVDASRVGLAGHSLGGYTALGLGGAWPSWKDHRVKAVLALSPYSNPYVRKGNLGGMKVPVMYQGGTRDLGITPTVQRQNGAYDRTSSPKIYVEFDGAGHSAWTNMVKQYQTPIDDYSVAFFDRYLKGAQPDPLAPLTGNPPPKGVSLLKVSR